MIPTKNINKILNTKRHSSLQTTSEKTFSDITDSEITLICPAMKRVPNIEL